MKSKYFVRKNLPIFNSENYKKKGYSYLKSTNLYFAERLSDRIRHHLSLIPQVY